MTVSTIPSSFSETAVQSSPSELSDELTTALATGRWWAIVEVTFPLSEQPDYWDLTWAECWGDIEAGENSCPPSLVFSDESEKAECPHSGFSDATLNTKESGRQKKTQSAPMPPGSQKGAPVPAYAEKRDHTSSLVFINASEKAESLCSGFSDATLKTMDQQRKWRQKKPQGALIPAGSSQGVPVSAGSSQGPPMLSRSDEAECGNSVKTTKQVWQDRRQKKPQGPSVPDGSSQGAPIPSGSFQGSLIPAGSSQGVPVSAGSSQGPPMLSRSDEAECGNSVKTAKQVWQDCRQKKPQGPPVPAGSSQGPPVPAGSSQGPPVPAESSQGRPVLAQSDEAECGNSVKTAKQVWQDWRQKKPQGSPVLAGSSQGAPIPAASSQGPPVRAGSPQRVPVPAGSSQGPPVPAVLAQSDEAECGNSVKTAKQVWQDWRQKKPQGAPVPAGSSQGPPVLAQWRQQQRQRRQQKASDSIDVCEPPLQKILCVEIDKVPLKPKPRRQNHQAPQPIS